jgi:D-sedoheptulose 7-phosphate isomerase/D-glycero-D-manno-heptose 1,7-bisphosphate phosphatase
MAYHEMDILMSRPGVLLDRDGTIIVDYHYVGHIERVQFIPGAIEAIRRFNQAGIPVAVITNQSGVARGFYPVENINVIHEYIEHELALHGAYIDLYLASPYHIEGSVRKYRKCSHFHKPRPGMATAAAANLDLDLKNSIVVGDRITDVQMARNIGAHSVYLGKDPLPVAVWDGIEFHYNAVSFPSLAAAATYIIERITGVSLSEFPTMRYSGINSFFRHYSDEITGTLSKVDRFEMERTAELLYKAYSDGSTVGIAGNGGAAAIADHMATDHSKHMAATNTMFGNVHSLSANHTVTTALANDIGYDAIYSWQLEQYAVKGDVLVVFSVSGESKNIIRALQCAKEMGMTSIAIVGGNSFTIGDAMLATVRVNIPATNYGVVEDVMSIIQHSLAQYIRQTQMSDHQIQSVRF